MITGIASNCSRKILRLSACGLDTIPAKSLLNLTSSKIDITSDHKTKAYFTKLAKNESDLALATTTADIASSQMETLVKRLSCDLKEDTCEQSTKDTTKDIRNVSDIKSFAIEVKKCGAVQTSHKFGEQFLKSARKLTDTTEKIPDSLIAKLCSKQF